MPRVLISDKLSPAAVDIFRGRGIEVVRERGYEDIRLLEEMVAEFAYRPTACKKSYRMIVLRKRVEVNKGQLRLFEEYRYFFYITYDRTMTAEEVVFSANDRCDQENLIAQLKGGVRALTTPVGDLVSNGAYMVMDRWRGASRRGARCWSRWRRVTGADTRRSAAHCCGWSSRPTARRSSGCRASSCGRAAG